MEEHVSPSSLCLSDGRLGGLPGNIPWVATNTKYEFTLGVDSSLFITGWGCERVEDALDDGRSAEGCCPMYVAGRFVV